MGSVEICGEYGGSLTKCAFDCGSKSSDEGNISPPYHRQRHISRFGDNGKTVKSSKTSWIAVRGLEYLCFVTRGIAQEKLDPPEIFSDCFRGPEAIVSILVDDSKVMDGYAASLSEFNEKVAMLYLRKIFRALEGNIANMDEDTVVKIAVNAFCRLHSWKVKADEIKVYVLEKDNQAPRALLIDKIREVFLDSHEESLEAEV